MTPPILSIYTPRANMVVTKGASLTIMAKATENLRVKLLSMYIDWTSNVRSSSDTITYTWNSTGGVDWVHVPLPFWQLMIKTT
jgi:hypothetical protein